MIMIFLVLNIYQQRNIKAETVKNSNVKHTLFLLSGSRGVDATSLIMLNTANSETTTTIYAVLHPLKY